MLHVFNSMCPNGCFRGFPEDLGARDLPGTLNKYTKAISQTMAQGNDPHIPPNRFEVMDKCYAN